MKIDRDPQAISYYVNIRRKTNWLYLIIVLFEIEFTSPSGFLFTCQAISWQLRCTQTMSPSVS